MKAERPEDIVRTSFGEGAAAVQLDLFFAASHSMGLAKPLGVGNVAGGRGGINRPAAAQKVPRAGEERDRALVDGDEQGSASLFSQLVLVGYFCVFGELTRVRDCFLLAGVAATTSLVTSADFDTERDLRSRVGVGSEP
jgi:hypothetical protein